MARRSGGTHKGVEEKRRMLPIYQHYTLSPGKTKSHHPEAKCNHCLKEFVCGSKQRLIRHLRKCNSISNPEQIIAETLNTLARTSANGQLNHSILEASNLLPSQISHIHHSTQQQLVGQAIHHSSSSATTTAVAAATTTTTTTLSSPSTTTTTANSNINNNNSNNANKITNYDSRSNSNNNNNNIISNHDTCGSTSVNDPIGLVATSTNGSTSIINNDAIPTRRRGRKPGNQNNLGPGIHVTTGLDGKTHFTPASQLPQAIHGTVVTSSPLITQVHNGRSGQVSYATYHHPQQHLQHQANIQTTSANPSITDPTGAHLNPGHLPCTTPNHLHHHSTPFKLNSEPIDKAYLKLVLTRNLPLSLCDTKEFQIWVKTFANDYKPPNSINLIAQNLRTEAQAARQRVSNILVKAPKKTINLELHCWPDELSGHSWYAIIAGVDHKRFLISVRDVNDQNNTTYKGSNASNTNSVNHSHADPGKVLTDFIDDCVRRVGSDRANSLILSGTNNGDSLVTLARKSLYTTHPSIVTYHCWWHYTNLLCSDIIEHNEIFRNVLRNSNSLINFINKRPPLQIGLEKFGPFAGLSSSLSPKKDDPRWYSHLICYLLEYIKNNNVAIQRALEAYSSNIISNHRSSDSNNNSSENSSQRQVIHQDSTSSTQQQQSQANVYQQDAGLLEIKSIIMSSDYWTNLNSALTCLKPIRDILALTLTVPNPHINSLPDSPSQQTPAILSNVANSLSLSDYTAWFLAYGKILFENWHQSQEGYKYQLIGQYIKRFNSSLTDLKLLFAAYLLNPKYRCAYMTQRAKDLAIEEILNIASEFMPEESDGHTIFDQWKLFLVREEPYDMVYDEARSSPLEWWMSLPCAESIRRVALRILRLKAFTSPRPETLFSQLYFYEDETRSSLSKSTFEDLAVLRYFYDYEDKIVQANTCNSLHNLTSNQNSLPSNGIYDRAQIGHVHNHHRYLSNDSTESLPAGPMLSANETNGQLANPVHLSTNETDKRSFSDSLSDVVVESYMNHNHRIDIEQRPDLSTVTNSLSLDNLPGYDQFKNVVDFNETGIRVIVEEPIEKKKRKWTAQEILSKCQSNLQQQHHHHQNNNNNNNNIAKG